MITLLQNPFLIVLLVIFAIAIAFGLRSLKLGKHLFAACNLSVLLLWLWGAVVWLMGLFGNDPSQNEIQILEEVSQKATNVELLENTKPKTTAFQNTLNRVNVFLDFSGSINAVVLLQRIQLLQSILQQAKESHFYYFGACMGGEIGELSTLDVAKIEQCKSQSCPNNRLLKADTDMLGVMQYTDQVLKQSADNKTLCLYITDDIQSPPLTDSTLAVALQPVFKNYAKNGVLFELIKLPYKNKKNLFISQYLYPSFRIDEVLGGDDIAQNLQQILQNRLAANDIRPAISNGEAPDFNAKLVLKIPSVSDHSDEEIYLPLSIRSEYKTMPLIVRLDSLITPTWQAIFKDKLSKQTYFWLEADTTTTLSLPASVTTTNGPFFLNQKGEQVARLKYQLIYPGSNQLSSTALYDTLNTTFKRINQFPFNGQRSSDHYVTASLPYHQRISWWMFWAYALLFAGGSVGIRRSIKPTMRGLKVVVEDSVSSDQSSTLIENTNSYVHKDQFGRELFAFKATGLKLFPLNIIVQPHDKVVMASSIPFTIGNGTPKTKAHLTARLTARAGAFLVGIR